MVSSDTSCPSSTRTTATNVKEEFDAEGNATRVANYFFIEGILGQGTYGQVRLARRRRRRNSKGGNRSFHGDGSSSSSETERHENDEEDIQHNFYNHAEAGNNPHKKDSIRIQTCSTFPSPPPLKMQSSWAQDGTPNGTSGDAEGRGRSLHQYALVKRSNSAPVHDDFFFLTAEETAMYGKKDHQRSHRHHHHHHHHHLEGLHSSSSMHHHRGTRHQQHSNNGSNFHIRSLSERVRSISHDRRNLRRRIAAVNADGGAATTTKTRTMDDNEEESLVAIKIFQKSILKRMRTMERNKETRKVQIKTALELVEREIALMKKLSHPNLVTFYEAIDSPESDILYMVIEYMPLGEILTYQNDGTFRRKEPKSYQEPLDGLIDGHFDEYHAALYFVDIMHGLAYLHQHHIVHRDLKPENILLDARGIARLGDFGVSHIFDDDAFDSENPTNNGSSNNSSSLSLTQQDTDNYLKMKPMSNHGLMTKTAGTWAFWSPEMCQGSTAFSGYAADIWAAGVCLYIFVTGRLPFYSTAPADLFDMIQNAPVPMLETDFQQQLSDNARELLKLTLEKDPMKRAGVGDCLKHPYLLLARAQRIQQLNTELARSKATNTAVEESDIQTAFRIVTSMPKVLLKSATKQIQEGLQAARLRLGVSSANHHKFTSFADRTSSNVTAGSARTPSFHERLDLFSRRNSSINESFGVLAPFDFFGMMDASLSPLKQPFAPNSINATSLPSAIPESSREVEEEVGAAVKKTTSYESYGGLEEDVEKNNNKHDAKQPDPECAQQQTLELSRPRMFVPPFFRKHWSEESFETTEDSTSRSASLAGFFRRQQQYSNDSDGDQGPTATQPKNNSKSTCNHALFLGRKRSDLSSLSGDEYESSNSFNAPDYTAANSADKTSGVCFVSSPFTASHLSAARRGLSPVGRGPLPFSSPSPYDPNTEQRQSIVAANKHGRSRPQQSQQQQQHIETRFKNQNKRGRIPVVLQKTMSALRRASFDRGDGDEGNGDMKHNDTESIQKRSTGQSMLIGSPIVGITDRPTTTTTIQSISPSSSSSLHYWNDNDDDHHHHAPPARSEHMVR